MSEPRDTATDVSEAERAQLDALAGLLRARNALDAEIVRIIGRPASTGNLGEFIAARIFDIHLAASGVNPGHDGYFASGLLEGKTVNIKLYSRDDALLDISVHASDYYLVMRGPRPAKATGPRALPFRIDSIYLFESLSLRGVLAEARVRVGVATSVRRVVWDAARIYPAAPGAPLVLTDAQMAMIAAFGAASS